MSMVALVTGGARGIGRSIVDRLLGDGYRVAILDVGEAPPAAPADDFCYVQGSVADDADRHRVVETIVARWGRLDVLVNNAGVAPTSRDDLLAMDPASYDRVLDINLRGPFFLTQLVANTMIELRAERDRQPVTPIGTIINIASISSTFVSLNRGEYCLSKAGVAMATQLFAARLAPESIVVYEVRPGIIATDMTKAVTAKYDDMIFEGGLVPMVRWGQPADVAAAVATLATGAMPYSTGDIVHVDGGLHIPRL